MESITNINDIELNQEIYSPASDKYFIVESTKYMDSGNDWWVWVRASNKNPEENGFSISLTSLKKDNYKISN